MTAPFTSKLRTTILASLVTVLLAYLIWRLADVLLLFTGSILVAVLLDGLARSLSRRLPIGRGLALLVVGLTLVGLGGAGVALTGPRISDQLIALVDNLEGSTSALLETAQKTKLGEWVLERLPEDLPGPTALIGGPIEEAAGAAQAMLSSVSDFFIVLLAGLYLSLDPDVYRQGTLRLLPPPRRTRGAEVLDRLASVLRRWLVARVVSMTVVGVMIGVGLALLGVPVALSLGLLAGAFSFVPFLGPISSLVPALIIAFAEGGLGLGAWVLGLYAGVQALESSLITPQIERLAVSLPPAFLIVVQVGFGVLGGLPGVVLATPLAVVWWSWCRCSTSRTSWVTATKRSPLRRAEDPSKNNLHILAGPRRRCWRRRFALIGRVRSVFPLFTPPPATPIARRECTACSRTGPDRCRRPRIAGVTNNPQGREGRRGERGSFAGRRPCWYHQEAEVLMKGSASCPRVAALALMVIVVAPIGGQDGVRNAEAGEGKSRPTAKSKRPDRFRVRFEGWTYDDFAGRGLVVLKIAGYSIQLRGRATKGDTSTPGRGTLVVSPRSTYMSLGFPDVGVSCKGITGKQHGLEAEITSKDPVAGTISGELKCTDGSAGGQAVWVPVSGAFDQDGL